MHLQSMHRHRHTLAGGAQGQDCSQRVIDSRRTAKEADLARRGLGRCADDYKHHVYSAVFDDLEESYWIEPAYAEDGQFAGYEVRFLDTERHQIGVVRTVKEAKQIAEQHYREAKPASK